MKNRLLLTTALCGLAFFTAAPAFAGCDINTSSSDGESHTCTGTDNVGFDTAFNHTTLTVDTGALINTPGADAVILHGTDETISILGAVNGNLTTIGDQGLITVNTPDTITGNVTIGNLSNIYYISGTINGDTTIGDGSLLSVGSGAAVTGAVNTGPNATILTDAGGTITGDISMGANAFYSGDADINGSLNATTSASITMDGTLTSGGDGIAIGNGTVNVGGSVIASGVGIRADAGNSTINIDDGASVTGGSHGIYFTTSGTGTVNVGAGSSISQSGGTSIQFGIGRAVLSITDTSTISGSVSTGVASNDSFTYVDNNGSTFDTDLFSTKYTGFEQFTKSGAGTTTLSGSTDKAWTITDGILSGDTGNFGVGTTTVTGNGTLEITSGAHQALDITGTGNFIADGGNDLRISGNNNFTGTTTVKDASTLEVDDAAALSATSGITIDDNSTFLFGSGFNGTTYTRNFTIGAGDGTLDTNGNSLTISGNLSGSGLLTKAGVGSLTLSGTSTATGGFDITSGQVIGTTDSIKGDTNMGSGTGLVLDQSTSGLYAGDISGGGYLVKQGTGTVTLTGTNAFSGGITFNAGTLAISSADNLGTGTNTFDGGTLSLTADVSLTNLTTLGAGGGTVDVAGGSSSYNGAISGAGDLTKTGAGQLILNSTNTFDGAVNIEGGMLRIGAADRLGNAVSGTNIINLSSGGILSAAATFGNARAMTLGTGGGGIEVTGLNTFTQGNTISGTGDLEKSGAGTLVLDSINTYSGVTTISDGTLALSNAANLGDGSATNDVVINGGTLQYLASFDQSRDIQIGSSGGTLDTNGFNSELNGNISGTGTFTKTGAGQINIANDNSGFSGQLVIDGGIVGIQSATDLGDGSVTNTLIIGNATLQIQSGIGVANDIELSNDATIETIGDLALSGDITGTSQLTKAGSGTLALSGDNSGYSGNWNLTNGYVALTSADQLGTGTSINFNGGGIQSDADLTLTKDITVQMGTSLFNTNGHNLTYTGALSGSGHIEKYGTGNLILNGTSTFSDQTEVFAGGLSVDGDYTAGNFIIDSGATLYGNGTLGSAEITGGNVAPGHSIGTLHSDFNFNFGNDSTYTVEYNDTGQSDQIISDNGTIGIIGSNTTLNLVGAAGAYAASTTYTILTANTGTILGDFDHVINNLAFLDPTVIYNTHNVQLRMDRNDVNFGDVAKDTEQKHVAGAITDLGSGNPIFDQFTGLTIAQAQDALDDLSGEHNAGVNSAITQSTGIIQSVLTTHMTNIAHASDVGDTAALAQPEDQTIYVAALMEPAAGSMTRNINAWMQAIGTIGSTNADHGGGTPGQDRHSYGALGGIDIAFEDGGAYGVFAGYERGEVTTNSEGASSDLNNYHLGAYATHPVLNGFTVSGGVGGTFHDINSVRHVTVGGLEFSPHSDTNAFTADAFAELSKPMPMNGLAIEPFAGVNVTYTHMDGYDETNGGAADLSVDGSNTINPATIIGARIGKSIDDVNLSASLGWQHTFGDIDGKITERFVGGTTDFDAFGAARSRDAAIIGLGIERNMGGMKAYAGYDGTISSNAIDHGFKAGLKWDF